MANLFRALGRDFWDCIPYLKQRPCKRRDDACALPKFRGKRLDVCHGSCTKCWCDASGHRFLVFSLRHRELLLGAYSQRRAELCDAGTTGSQSSPLHFTCTRLFTPKSKELARMSRELPIREPLERRLSASARIRLTGAGTGLDAALASESASALV